MIQFNWRIVGAEQVELHLRQRSQWIRARLFAAVARASILLTRYVKEEKLSGQVLNVRTGTLRRKINYRMRETPNSITGVVGVKLAYAAIHEYGFDGDESVRAHLRRITQAFGRPLASPVTAEVRAYTRHVHMPERSFLRSSLRELTPTIHDMLVAAVQSEPT